MDMSSSSSSELERITKYHEKNPIKGSELDRPTNPLTRSMSFGGTSSSDMEISTKHREKNAVKGSDLARPAKPLYRRLSYISSSSSDTEIFEMERSYHNVKPIFKRSIFSSSETVGRGGGGRMIHSSWFLGFNFLIN